LTILLREIAIGKANEMSHEGTEEKENAPRYLLLAPPLCIGADTEIVLYGESVPAAFPIKPPLCRTIRASG